MKTNVMTTRSRRIKWKQFVEEEGEEKCEEEEENEEYEDV